MTDNPDRPRDAADRPSIQEGGISVGGDATFHDRVAGRDMYNVAEGKTLDEETRKQIKELLEQLAKTADEDRSIPREARAEIITQAEEAKKEVDQPDAPQTLAKRVEGITNTLKALGEGVSAAAPLYAIVKGISLLIGVPLP